MPRPRCAASTSTIEIQAIVSKRVTQVVPTGWPSHSATKQPAGSSDKSRCQSAGNWFQPAAPLSRQPSGTSSRFITRIWSMVRIVEVGMLKGTRVGWAE